MKMQPFDIRPASAEDLVELVGIERNSFSSPWSEDSICSFIQDDLNRACFVAAISGSPFNVVGYVAIQYVLDEAEISNIAVSPEIRGGGVGRALLSKAVSFLAEKGVHKIFLEVRESNIAARSLYASFGFESIGRRPKYYSNPDEDAIICSVSITAFSTNC